MALRIGTNLNALNAARNLDRASSKLSSAYERLSSGLRINSASDDAAGLAIATSLQSDSRIFGQAIRNVNDGISLLNIAEGALNSLSSISQRQLELAAQAANGNYSSTQRSALDNEAQALQSEYQRIVESTKFNGTTLLDGSLSSGLRIQAGTGLSNSLLVTLDNMLATNSALSPTGTYQAGVAYTMIGGIGEPAAIINADFNGDGVADIVTGNYITNNISIALGNGDGTFNAARSYYYGDGALCYGDFDGDGKLDVVSQGTSTIRFLHGNGDGSFALSVSYAGGVSSIRQVISTDINGDGKLDVLATNNGDNSVWVMLGNGDGTFNAGACYYTDADPRDVTLADFNNDGKMDLITANTGGGAGGSQSILLGNGDGTFKAQITWADPLGTGPRGVATGDFNGDGNTDYAVAHWNSSTVAVFLGNGNGSFKARQTYEVGNAPNKLLTSDLNGDGILDIAAAAGGGISVIFGNSNGTFNAAVTNPAGSASGITIGDFNGDGVSDLATATYGLHGISVLGGIGESSQGLPAIDLTTQSAAQTSMTTIQTNLDAIELELGNVGAQQSRFNVATNNLETMRQNYTAAYSRIMDADIAEETAALVKNQVLQQAAAAILAQANLEGGLVLKLLK